jgi:two-component system, cell cycle sensor histidine kinase and response regulator CckA
MRPDGSMSLPFATPTLEDLFGVHIDEVRDDFGPAFGRCHPDDVEHLQKSITDSAQTMQPWRHSFRFMHPEKGTIWLEGNSVPRAEPDGSILWHGFVQDVTERRKADEAVRESEAKWRSYIENAPVGVLVADSTGRHIEANRAAEQMLGYGPGELINTLAAELPIDPGDTEVQRHFNELRTLGTSDAVFPVRCRDGRSIPISVRASAIPGDRYLAIFQDITLSVEAEQEIRHQSGLIRSLLDSIPDLIFYKDLNGIYLGCNPTFAEFAGRPRHEIIGRTDHDLFPAEVADNFRLNDRLMLESLEPRHNEEMVWYADGRTALFETLKTPYWGPDGKLLGVLGVSRDITARKQAKKALEESEERFRSTLENMIEGCQIIGFDWRYRYLNRAAAQQGRHTLDTLLGRTMMESFPGIETTAMFGMLRKCMEERIPDHMENEFEYPDGTNGWFQLVVQPVPEGIFLLSLDITERKRAEEALRQSEERYRGLVETSFDWIWEVDAGGRFSYVSPRVETLLGYTPEEVLGRHPTEFMPEEEARRARSFLADVHSRQLAFSNFECFYIRKDGRHVVVEASAVPVLNEKGELAGYRGIDRDITGRREAETARNASEARLRTLVESAPTGIFVQAGHTFRYMNKVAAGMLGAASPEELIGRPILGRFHPDNHEQVQERLRVLNDEIRPVPAAEERCLRLDGTEFDAEFSAVPFDYDGEPGALVFFQDITERKRLESQLRQAQKLEAIGQLAGGVAHDFNNILAAVMMHLGLLQMNPHLGEEVRQALGDIDVQAQRAASLTRQLLMFSRRSVLAVKSVDLNDVVGNLLRMLTRLIGEHIQLRFDGISSLPLIEADSGMLEQVLLNLVVNARDSMPKGGRITIETSTASFSSGEEGNGGERRPGDFVCVTVSDTGTGMDTATIKRIFEPFFTTKEAGKGTGLGLATVHGIVAQHKGWVEVNSRLGHGATFRVYLPALSGEGANMRETPKPTRPLLRGGSETLLIVEDDASVRRLTGESLARLGYNVHEASNGHEALRLWETEGGRVDLLITDMVMPEGMTGMELVERLQSLKPGLRAILASGYSSEIAQAGVPENTGILYLAKPYDTQDLADAVRTCLDKTR